jgi:DtxR family Mn-dependent transcriptional regulator
MVGVSLGTVTNTIESLERRDFVSHEPYRGVKLTETGRRIAIDVLRRHRLAERLLTDLLNIEWSKVHEYACQFEHAIPEDLTGSLEEALGYPKTCPHGNPIPTANGGISEEQAQPLTDLTEGAKGVLIKTVNEQQDLLNYLQTLNLVPGVSIEIVEKAPFNGPITIKIDGRRRAISPKIASNIWVQEEEVE